MLQRLTQPVLDVRNEHGGIKAYQHMLGKGLIHTPMCGRSFTVRGMERTPDERRQILRALIKARGLKIATWAKNAGVDKNSVYNFLNSHSQSLDLRTYAKLARAIGEPVWKLTGDTPEPPSPTSIWVAGSVEAGVFVEAVEWDSSDWYAVDVPVPARFRGKAKALQVRGPSMNIDYPDGSVAVYVDMLDFRPPRDGDDVVVYSNHKNGTVEATLKTFRIDERGDKWLWPRSHDPRHQLPVNTRDLPEDIDTIEIVGVVIGCYRAWHH